MTAFPEASSNQTYSGLSCQLTVHMGMAVIAGADYYVEEAKASEDIRLSEKDALEALSAPR